MGDCRDTNAIGPYLGYNLQTVRFLYRLLKADEGEVISLEAIGDVSSEAEDVVIVEEDKSGLATNPVSNKSVSLWKTFYNWLVAVQDGKIPIEKSIFILHVLQPKECDIANLFSEAKTLKDTKTALSKARQELAIGPNPPDKEWGIYAHTFLTDKSGQNVKIIQQFRLEFGNSDPLADVRKHIHLHAAIEPEYLERAIGNLLGDVSARILTQTSQNLPAYVHKDDFLSSYKSIIQDFNRYGYIPVLGTEPSKSQVNRVVAQNTLIKQIRLVIEDDKRFEDEAIKAATCYLRSSHERTIWGTKGVRENQFLDEFHGDLKSHYNRTKDEIDITHNSHPDQNRGHLLFLKCVQHQQTINGKTLPDFFTPGCYHGLAETKEIGWHPQYRTLLDDDDGGAE